MTGNEETRGLGSPETPQREIVGMLGPNFAPLAAPLWGGLADRSGIHRHLLTSALLGTLVAGFSYSLTSLFTLLFLISLIYAFLGSAIAPGFFLTQQNRFLLINEATGELTERGRGIIERTPMGRFGMPEDLVSTVLWLASPGSAFVNGVVIPVDGGFSAFSGV